jgi:hypothetical protein
MPSFSCEVGQTILMSNGRGSIEHLWIVVENDIPGDPDSMIVVNISSLREGSDNSTILTKGDHPFIKHDSSVVFGDAQIVLKTLVQQFADLSPEKIKEKLEDQVLERIEEGLLLSKRTKKGIKQICKDCWDDQDEGLEKDAEEVK